jgi:hypothetical protein
MAQLLSTKTGFRFVHHATMSLYKKETIEFKPYGLLVTENLSSKEKLAPEILSSY